MKIKLKVEIPRTANSCGLSQLSDFFPENRCSLNILIYRIHQSSLHIDTKTRQLRWWHVIDEEEMMRHRGDLWWDHDAILMRPGTVNCQQLCRQSSMSAIEGDHWHMGNARNKAYWTANNLQTKRYFRQRINSIIENQELDHDIQILILSLESSESKTKLKSM